MLLQIALLTSAMGSEGAFPFVVETTQLENGLTLHVVPMGTPDVATVITWFAVGSRDEVDPGRTGFAHFFEHLAFYGTETMSGDAREQALLRMGAEDNAWTWFDETVYHTVLPAKDVPALLAIEADRFQHLHLTPQDIQKESGAVYGEYRKNAADPGNAVSTALYGTAFGAHTYGHDTIGYEADIQAMPDAFAYSQAFFDRFYRPGNATLLVVGDVDPTAITAVVREHWASWEPATQPRPEIPVEPEQTGIRRKALTWTGPTAAQLAMGWKIPGAASLDPSLVALQGAADLLFGPVGPLQRRLVREEAIAYGVWGGRDDHVDPGLFTVTVMLKDPAALEQAEAIVREEIGKLGEGVDPAAWAATQSHERYAFLTGLESPAAVGNALGHALRREPDPKAIDRWWAAYAALDGAAISQAVRDTFVDARLTVVTLVPPAVEAP